MILPAHTLAPRNEYARLERACWNEWDGCRVPDFDVITEWARRRDAAAAGSSLGTSPDPLSGSYPFADESR